MAATPLFAAAVPAPVGKRGRLSREVVATAVYLLTPVMIACGGNAFDASKGNAGSAGKAASAGSGGSDPGPAVGGKAGSDRGGSASAEGGDGQGSGSDSAGQTSVAGAGAGGAGPMFEACPSDALICESFDENLGVFEPFQSGGMVSRDHARVFRGQAAVKFETDGSMSGQLTAARLRAALAPPLKTGSLYVRFNAFFPSEVKLDSWAVIFEWSHDDGEHKVSFDFLVDRFQLAVPPSPVAKGGLIPRDRWFCVLLAADISDQGSLRVQVDDRPAVNTEGDVLPQHGVDHFLLGITASEEQSTPVDFSIDEVTAATTPLSCPDP